MEKILNQIIFDNPNEVDTSDYANMSEKQRIQGDQFVLINKFDSDKRSISNGDKVISSESG